MVSYRTMEADMKNSQVATIVAAAVGLVAAAYVATDFSTSNGLIAHALAAPPLSDAELQSRL
jgi:hypothetical protein